MTDDANFVLIKIRAHSRIHVSRREWRRINHERRHSVGLISCNVNCHESSVSDGFCLPGPFVGVVIGNMSPTARDVWSICYLANVVNSTLAISIPFGRVMKINHRHARRGSILVLRVSVNLARDHFRLFPKIEKILQLACRKIRREQAIKNCLNDPFIFGLALSFRSKFQRKQKYFGRIFERLREIKTNEIRIWFLIFSLFFL